MTKMSREKVIYLENKKSFQSEITFFPAYLKGFQLPKIVSNFRVYPIQDGWEVGQKDPPTSFSPVTSTNVGISSQNVLTFSFNPFDRLV